MEMVTKNLSDIAEIISGQSPPSSTYNDDKIGLPFYQGKTDFGERFPTVRKYCSNPKRVAEPMDILISVRAPVGPVNFAKERSAIGRGLAALRVKDDVSREYLFEFLKANQRYVARYATGSTFKAIAKSELAKLKIDLPKTFDDQKRIAQVLSDCEELIQLRKQSIALLDELVKSTFLEMFGDPVQMSKSKLESLGDHLNFLTSGSRGWSKYYSESGSKFLRIQNIGNGYLKEENYQLVNAPESTESNRTRVVEGDLIMSITADLGRTAVIPRNFDEAHINQHLALIRLKSSLDPVYAAYYFAMPFGNAQIQRKDKDGVKSGLNFTDIKEFQVYVPDLNEQKSFVLKVNSINQIKDLYQEQLQELEKLYARLSQDAFKGELDLSGVVLRDEQPDLSEHTLESLFESIDLHKLVAAVTRMEEKNTPITHGRTYVHKTLSNAKLLEKPKMLEEVSFKEHTFGMFSKQVATALDSNPYLKQVGKGTGQHFEVRTSKQQELDKWMQQKENKEFIAALKNVLQIYQHPQIGNDLYNIELFNTVLRCCLVLNTTDFEPVFEKMKNWKTEGTEFKNKAEKFGVDRIKGMFGFVKKTVL